METIRDMQVMKEGQTESIHFPTRRVVVELLNEALDTLDSGDLESTRLGIVDAKIAIKRLRFDRD